MINMKKHYNVVAAVIKKDNLFFATQRGAKGECAFKWEFPGGKIEANETNEEALIREIREELETEIDVLKYICTVDNEYETFSITISAYECRVVSGNLKLSEHVNSKWVTIDELKEMDFANADKKIIKML